MSTSFDFEGWDSDVELGANVFEFGDTETSRKANSAVAGDRPGSPPALALYVGDHRHRASSKLRDRRFCGRVFPSGRRVSR
jgi:hypothetical protein